MTLPVFGAHGYAFDCESDDSTLSAKMRDAFATLRLPGATPHSTYRITRNRQGHPVLWHDDQRIDFRLDDDNLLLLLQWHVNMQVIARATTRSTTFHAAAARSPGGVGIVLAAPMEAGKTTTVTGLLRAGWGYLTDEAASVEPDGTLLAYPKPLTLDFGSWPLFPDLKPPGHSSPTAQSWLVPATAVGAEVVSRARLGLIVFPAYRPGAPTHAQELTPARAALGLCHSTFEFDRNGARDLHTIAALARTVPAYQLQIGRLDEALAAIDELATLAAAA